MSRKATILGSQNIILGGKCIIQHGTIIRGDLKRNHSVIEHFDGECWPVSADTVGGCLYRTVLPTG